MPAESAPNTSLGGQTSGVLSSTAFPEAQSLDLQAHLRRVDGLLLKLESQLQAAQGSTPSSPAHVVAAAPERQDPPATDPLSGLMLRFGLSLAEADLLRLAVAAELSPEHAQILSQLQGDKRLRRPQVLLALKVLEPNPERQPGLLPLLQEHGRLRHHRLLELAPPWRDRLPLFTEQELQLPSALLMQLTGVRSVDPSLLDAARLFTPETHLSSLHLPPTTRETLERLQQLPATTAFGFLGPRAASRLLVYVHGAYGTGRRSVSQALASHWKLGLLEVDLQRGLEDPERLMTLVVLALRDARRLGALPCFRQVDRLFDRPTREQTNAPVDPLGLERFLELLRDFPGPIVLTGEHPAEPGPLWYQRHFMSVGLPLPSTPDEQRLLWQQALAPYLASQPMLSWEHSEPVLRQFTFSPGQMHDAMRAAESRAATRNPLAIALTLEDLRAGCGAQFKHRLESLSRKTATPFTMEDLILPDSIKGQLKMFEGFIRNRDRVYDDWGLGRKLSGGRGVKALFYGASGTGKTLAASVIACTLGIELFKVDLSTLVSKWVGETEKNLDRVFTEAQKSHSILLFDEADSLFGKRGAVEKGTDRYSNMEINYLLQRFEEYDGVVILTSNFPRGIDDAFSRRMHFIIEFPTPDEDMRLALWKSKLPPELPLDPDLNLGTLVKQFELTGGNIQNIVLGASFIAAERNASVSMRDIMQAIKWEYQKIGRSVTRTEFKDYFEDE